MCDGRLKSECLERDGRIYLGRYMIRTTSEHRKKEKETDNEKEGENGKWLAGITECPKSPVDQQMEIDSCYSDVGMFLIPTLYTNI